MTRPDDRVAAWALNEMWGAPPEATAHFSEEENLAYGKALIMAAGGDGLTPAEREWILGYVATGGHSPEVLEQLSSYAGGDDVDSLFTRGIQKEAQRVCIYDAIRACGSDGDLSEEELATVRRMAETLGVPAEVVDEFVAIYREEQGLKHRRISLAFPIGVENLVEVAASH